MLVVIEDWWAKIINFGFDMCLILGNLVED